MVNGKFKSFITCENTSSNNTVKQTNKVAAVGVLMIPKNKQNKFINMRYQNSIACTMKFENQNHNGHLCRRIILT